MKNQREDQICKLAMLNTFHCNKEPKRGSNFVDLIPHSNDHYVCPKMWHSHPKTHQHNQFLASKKASRWDMTEAYV